jgi:hypothetical protein
VASSCEHGDEPLGSIKCREFLDLLSVLLASQGLCSMELVNIVEEKGKYVLYFDRMKSKRQRKDQGDGEKRILSLAGHEI